MIPLFSKSDLFKISSKDPQFSATLEANQPLMHEGAKPLVIKKPGAWGVHQLETEPVERRKYTLTAWAAFTWDAVRIPPYSKTSVGVSVDSDSVTAVIPYSLAYLFLPEHNRENLASAVFPL